MSFVVVPDADRVRAYLGSAGLREVVAADVSGRAQHVFGRDWRRQPVERWVSTGRAPGPPPAGWTAAATDEDPDRPGGDLSRAAFEQAVAEALRTWHAPGAFATGALVRSRLVPRDSADPAADLRGAVLAALDALRTDPAGVRAYQVVTATYIAAARTHKAASRRPGVPYGTFRRHLALARERLVEQLLRRTA